MGKNWELLNSPASSGTSICIFARCSQSGQHKNHCKIVTCRLERDKLQIGSENINAVGIKNANAASLDIDLDLDHHIGYPEDGGSCYTEPSHSSLYSKHGRWTQAV